MHILFREQRTLDEAAAAVELGHSPADLVLLSFSDADLGAAAMAWRHLGDARPGLRLANLAQLRHPLSVDLYAEQVLAHAKTVIVRLLGGLDYWRYGCEELLALAQARGIALAVIAGDGQGDSRLQDFCTVGGDVAARFDGYFREGGPANLANALRLGASLAGLGAPPEQGPVPVPRFGLHDLPMPGAADAPLAALVFYRSHLLSGDIAPVESLAEELAKRGIGAQALYVDSLKSPDAAAFVAARLRAWQPRVVLNATGFSARGEHGSPLDAAGCPVLQLILAGSTQEAWRNSTRGLSPADMAMQIVLPECDGRLSTTAISFKMPGAPIEALEFAQTIHRPDAGQIALVADRAEGWIRLAESPAAARRIALVLSDYPGAAGAQGQIGHAVGLDSFASLGSIAGLLHAAGYSVPAGGVSARLRNLAPAPFLSVAEYKSLFAGLAPSMQAEIHAAWGAPEEDDSVRDFWFVLPHLRAGNLIVAVQPDRGAARDRKASYHDPDLPPRHAYVAFYLWLRLQERIHAMVHLGAHGTLEWLPGKALAPDHETCFPTALCRGLPVIYPFIVNNPGEAAVARRRLGAVVLGHLTPPLKVAGAHGAASSLERLIDDYAAADGLDRRRTEMLRDEILTQAAAAGLLEESGCKREMPADDQLARLDAYLCDVKELQIRDGLHVFGRPPAPERRAALLASLRAAAPQADPARLEAALDASAEAEGAGLLAALEGRFVAPGPAGAPSRGRADVLPTGRNLYSLDPRAVPTRAAMALAGKTAEAILRRHLQEQGDWPRRLVIDLWGSAALRTGGEDLALAFILMGAAPVWDDESNRINGVEILPLAVLDRPRVDVTLRISGLFRDAFETQLLMFDMAVQSIAARDEPADFNSLAGAARGLEGAAWRAATTRIFGPAPGAYGTGLAEFLADKTALGETYLAAGAYAYGQGLDGGRDAQNFAARVAGADGFIHQQDHAEIDVLDGLDFAAFEGGFAAAAASLGAAPALYHVDSSRPDAPRVRLLAEEIARVVRGRAANPAWIAGMMRHDYRGAAEISRALDGLYAFAATMPERFDAQFDLLFDATLGNQEVDSFLHRANPAAHEAMRQRFARALEGGLWRNRRNSVAARLAEP
ncbi:MAG TPA: cobaltochelatase subunit CobN [Acidocella sp.]|jgi:cobaltochelatase CobN|uniref:cobaltochelatase subunit CobN n=1 Tax=Acidocella sp. TaxID=50710 RepID=UPI002D006766|nr:cobaltochelatase subunit CobN [Acidocella sp.]HVE22773.1 cobaltochelatase subunit CobN [Acidocella sp.]